jgi:alkaline phosphatase
MLKVKIQLQGEGNRWQVKETSIDYDGHEVQRLGSMDEVMDYEEAIKAAKRWMLLMACLTSF